MLTSSDWQQQLREVVTDPAELLSLLQLPVSILDDIMAAGQTFKLRIPRSFIQRIKPGNFKDPLLLQVLPQVDELISMPGYSPDPLQEQAASPVPGLLHKYFGRVLLTMAGSCAVNCRYCFRRSFPYQAHIPDQAAWQKILNYIANDS
ncbi:MAG: EF-P beta-lysylation protein EpmB, partial [Gammaproteobacteria bacterium]|nr:EF-P beta-lysylation protein EpmB [Gammaproteobacteria bacterium]